MRKFLCSALPDCRSPERPYSDKNEAVRQEEEELVIQVMILFSIVWSSPMACKSSCKFGPMWFPATHTQASIFVLSFSALLSDLERMRANHLL